MGQLELSSGNSISKRVSFAAFAPPGEGEVVRPPSFKDEPE